MSHKKEKWQFGLICCVMLHMTETVRQNWRVFSVCSVKCCLCFAGLEMNSDSPQHNDDHVLTLLMFAIISLPVNSVFLSPPVFQV